MKRNSIFSALSLLCLFGAVSCEKNLEGILGPRSGQISFSVASSYENVETKTEYSGKVSNSKERIDWLKDDEIYIYSPQAEVDNVHYAIYKVTGATASGEYSSAKITVKEKDHGLEWTNADTHEFMAFYPSVDQNSNLTLTPNESTLKAEANIPAVQEVTAENEDGTDAEGYKWILKPDMSYAYMYASATAGKSGSTVNLGFKPMVTTFYFELYSVAEEEEDGGNVPGTPSTKGKIRLKVNGIELASTNSKYLSVTTLESIEISSASKAMSGDYTATIASDGSIKYDFPEKTDDNCKVTVSVPDLPFTLAEDSENQNKITFTIFALPQEYKDLTITFNTDKGARMLALYDTNNNAMTFEGGKKYNFTNIQLPKMVKDAMKLTIKTSEAGTSFYLPFNMQDTAPAKMLVDWGDGNKTQIPKGTTLTEDYISHSYSESNTYTITIYSYQCDSTSQQIPAFGFGEYPYKTGNSTNDAKNNKANAVHVISVDTPILNVGGADNLKGGLGYTSITSVSSDLLSKNTDVASLNYFFNECSQLGSVPEDLFNNLESITGFVGTFLKCTSLASIPENLFEKNTKVTDFGTAFSNCSKVPEIPVNLFKNNKEVKSFSSTFSFCSSITKVPEGLFDENPNVTSFSSTFNCCTSLESIPVSLFQKNEKVTDFTQTFYTCSSLTEIYEDLFINNKAVTSFSGTFRDCKIITTIPEGIFRNNTKVTSFSQVFYSCSKVKTIPSKLFVNNTAVTSFESAFGACSSLEEIGADLFKTNLKVTTFNEVFYRCSSLTEVPDALFAYNSAVTSFKHALSQCPKLVKFENVFIDPDNGITKETRFASMTKAVDISSLFTAAGSNNAEAAASYNLINFAEYTFGAGYEKKSNNVVLAKYNGEIYEDASENFINYSGLSEEFK